MRMLCRIRSKDSRIKNNGNRTGGKIFLVVPVQKKDICLVLYLMLRYRKQKQSENLLLAYGYDFVYDRTGSKTITKKIQEGTQLWKN